MRIGIDYIAAMGGGGNSVYTKNLVDALIKESPESRFYLYVYVHDFLKNRLNGLKKDNVRIRPVYINSLGLPIPKSIITGWNSIAMRFWSKVDRLDTLHITNPLNFISGIKNTLVTIHDLSNFHDASWTKIGSHSFLEKNMKAIVYSAARLIVVSEYTKKDLIQMFGVSPEKISVVYEAANPEVFYPDSDPHHLLDKFGLKSYILYAGQLQPRKNIVNIIKAYADLSPVLKEKYKLVLAGGARDLEYAELIKKTIESCNVSSHVKMLGRVSTTDLRKLYSGAHVFVFPSLFEGFGLPVLESLRCGTPVIVSNSTSLPEVTGEAGFFVDPYKVNEIQEALTQILTDKNYYENLKNKTLLQAEKFSWDKAAQKTIKLYGS